MDVTVSLTTPGCPISATSRPPSPRLSGRRGRQRCNVGFDVLSDQEKGELQRKLGRPGGLPEGALAQVKNVICVGSGKGGVGKSSLTANLGSALAAEGKRSASSTPTSGATRSRACSASAPTARRSTASARSSRSTPTA